MDNLPTARNFSQPKSSDIRGGAYNVRGWDLKSPRDLQKFIEEGLREDTDIHPSINSIDEALRFIRGVEEYSDRNSFFIDAEDEDLRSEEGFFREMYCEECEKEFIEQLMNSEGPLDAKKNFDPDIHVYSNEEEVKSFRPGYDRFVKEVVYECPGHPEVSLGMRDTWYEEQ